MKKNIIILAFTSLFSFSSLADVVVVGNPALPDGMSKSDAKKVFLGKKSKYAGGNLKVIELTSANAEKEEFRSKVTKKSLAQLESYWSKQLFTGKGKPPVEVSNSNMIKAMIAQNPKGIGYIDEANVDGSVKVLFKP